MFNPFIRQQTFVTSDHHFKRELASDKVVKNDELVQLWNSVVAPNDTVFHLGDFGDTSRLGMSGMNAIVEQLKGHIVLILGNHDRNKSARWWFQVGIHEVISYPIIFDQFILSHKYLREVPYPFYNIHGHYHLVGQKFISDRHINVAIQFWDRRPVNIETIIKLINER